MQNDDLNVRPVLTFVYLLALLYVCLGAFAWFFAESMIFQPQPPSYANSEQIIKIPAGSNDELAAIHLENPDADYTILFSHGNAEDIGHLLPLLRQIRRMGFSILAYDYRGYGQSSGRASEENSYEDINAAYNYLSSDLDINPQKIIAHGRSLGGAVAIDLASRKKVGGLIIESTFVTAYRVMTRIPLYPFDQYRNIAKIDQIDCPVLFMHGEKDRVIPFWHGKALFEEAKEPKMKLWIETAGHNDLFYEAGSEYQQALLNFTELIN